MPPSPGASPPPGTSPTALADGAGDLADGAGDLPPPPPPKPPVAPPPTPGTSPAAPPRRRRSCRRRRRRWGVTSTHVSSYPQTPLVGAATIKRIVVEENSETDADTVILISKLEVGDSFTADMADTVKADLISSGLFKDVIVYWTNVEGGLQIHLVVKDKHSWVIAPAFYNQPTNVGGGVGFGENNLFGKNQKLLLYGQIATGRLVLHRRVGHPVARRHPLLRASSTPS